jgi:hypothetical protein
MTGMLNLRDVLELVIDSFNDGSLSEHELVGNRHQPVLHVLSNGCNNLQSLNKEFIEQSLRYVTFVCEELTKQPICHDRYRFSVIFIAWGQVETKDLSLIVDDQMELEAIEPTCGGLTTPSQTRKDPVSRDAQVVTDSDGR